jgi:hypothetical protein
MMRFISDTWEGSREEDVVGWVKNGERRVGRDEVEVYLAGRVGLSVHRDSVGRYWVGSDAMGELCRG